MSKTSLQMLENVINVTFLTNKWLMWSEQKLPKHCVYVPVIFQMRDAYSHIMKMFGNGFDKKLLSVDNNSLFQEFFCMKDTKYQIEETFSHTARAFFDIADYIIIELLDIVNGNKKYPEAINTTLRRKLLVYQQEVSDIRKEKSSFINNIMETINIWDSKLSILAFAYDLPQWENELDILYEEVQKVVNRIKAYPREIIKDYSKNFYSELLELVEIKKIPEKFKNVINEENLSIGEDTENPIELGNQMRLELNKRIKQLEEKKVQYNRILDELQKSGEFADRSKEKLVRNIDVGIKDTIIKLIPSLITLIISPIFSYYILINNVIGDLSNSGNINTVKVLNSAFLGKFILLSIIFIVIFYAAWVFIKRLILNKLHNK